MYAIAIFAGLVNLVVVCQPSTFDPNFSYNSQPDDLTRDFFCQGTPATPDSYWGSLILTIITYIFGLAVTPTFLITWWLGYYLWFSSMYYQCLAFFPSVYNVLFNRTRKKTRLLLQIIITFLVLNIAILVGFWYIFKAATPYPKNEDDTVAYELAKNWNIGISSYYLFGPFWALYFSIGAATAFLYDAYRPTEQHTAWIWVSLQTVVPSSCLVLVLPTSARASPITSIIKITSSICVRMMPTNGLIQLRQIGFGITVMLACSALLRLFGCLRLVPGVALLAKFCGQIFYM